MFSKFLVLLAAAAAGSVHAVNYSVTVGGPNGEPVFIPSFVNNVVKGDLIIFNFTSPKYSIVRSSLDKPCQPTNFWPFIGPITGPLGYLNIPTADGIYAYATGSNNCQNGMVFAVNPGNNFAAFQATAKGATSTSATTSGFATSRSATATATSSSASPSSTSTPTNGTDWPVTVGGQNMIFFSPNNVTGAVPGDTVTFTFAPRNHSVVQSSADSPCVPKNGGFNSGFQIVSPDAATGDSSDGPAGPTFQITINDTNPIYAFDGFPANCHQGMLFSINAPDSGDQSITGEIAKARSSSAPKVTYSWLLATFTFLLFAFTQ